MDGAHTVYAYDASGQRVLQATVAFGTHAGTATAYTPAGQVEDADTSATTVGDVTGTRYYTFGGATVAVRTHDGKLALVLGDEQGSVSVTMPVTLTASGAMASASIADAQAATRTSYTPYGQLRGADNLALDRGWLGQVEDRTDPAAGTGTGLTYLNARYYDPALARFITPDPLMNPADPATLDPYRYADNNPVVFTDANGLAPNKISDDDAYRKAAPTVAKKTAAVVAVKKATGQMPSSANPGGGKKPSTGGGISGGSGGGGSASSVPNDILQVVGVGSCTGSAADAAACAGDGAESWTTGNGYVKTDIVGRYRSPAGLPDVWKSLRSWAFGPTGRHMIAFTSHLDNGGPLFEIVGAVASLQDSMNRMSDLGAADDMSAPEKAAYAFLRWGAGELGGTLGMYYGASLGAQAGVACGEGAVVCSPAFAVVGAFVLGAAGDSLATGMFDHLMFGDAYLRWRDDDD